MALIRIPSRWEYCIREKLCYISKDEDNILIYNAFPEHLNRGEKNLKRKITCDLATNHGERQCLRLSVMTAASFCTREA